MRSRGIDLMSLAAGEKHTYYGHRIFASRPSKHFRVARTNIAIWTKYGTIWTAAIPLPRSYRMGFPFRLVDISQHNPSDGRSDPEILRRRRKTHSSSNVPKMASVILEVNLMYYYTGLGGWRLAGAGTTRPI